MPQPYLSIRRLSKRFGRFVALDDVSLDVAMGEFLCVLGPSGCGKTTLLRIIGGLETQDNGRILQDGRDISSLPAEKRRFGIVFQSYALFPNLTAAQNVAYGLRNLRRPRAEVDRRVDELLSMVGLADSHGQYPSQLSGGQQQRVALARALAISPSLLLLDEPLSALDAQVRVALRVEMARVHRQLGITTIMVTHDQAEALALADRIAVIDRGRIVQIGSPADIYQRPASPFVARFVGAMNIFAGTAGYNQGEVCAGTLSLKVQPGSNGLYPGKPIQVAIRPEDVRVGVVAPGVPNTTNAVLRSVEFLGPFHRLVFDLDQPPVPLVADLPARDIRRLGAALAPGADIPVQLPPECLLVYHTNTNTNGA